MKMLRLDASDLNDDMDVIVEQNVYPKSAKVKLRDLKKYFTADLDMKLKEVKRIAQGDSLASSISI